MENLKDLRILVGNLEKATGDEQIEILQEMERILLTKYVVKVKNLIIEPLIIEAYYYDKDHFADSNTHKCSEQQQWNILYRHSLKPDLSVSGRTGGVDICLACNGECFADENKYYLSFLIKNALISGEVCRQVKVNAILNRLDAGKEIYSDVLVSKAETISDVIYMERSNLAKDCYSKQPLAAVTLSALAKYKLSMPRGFGKETAVKAYLNSQNNLTRAERGRKAIDILGYCPKEYRNE